MQIESIASTVAITAVTPIAAHGGPSANSDDQSAIVERTSAGYEAYVAAPPGPIVTGPSIEDVEFRLHSTVQFQA